MLIIFDKLADWVTYDLLNLVQGTSFAEAVHFFILDVSKILVLLTVLIYIIAIARAYMNVDKVRGYLKGKNRFVGYFLAACFGAVTPFCSCSSIPLFIGFTAARIPIGITMSFLITSPIINEVAVILLGSTLGWAFTLSYVLVGILAGMFGGIFFDFIKGERFLKPLDGVKKSCCDKPADAPEDVIPKNWQERHQFAKYETKKVVGNIWHWVIIGIGIGALFHGFVPESWVQSHLGADSWWTVPIASVIGIPLYADATAIIPIAESLMGKGVPVGTTLTFMMSVVGASLPGFILLKQVMKPKLLVSFFFLLLIIFTVVGWLFNAIGPLLFSA